MSAPGSLARLAANLEHLDRLANSGGSYKRRLGQLADSIVAAWPEPELRRRARALADAGQSARNRDELRRIVAAVRAAALELEEAGK